MNSPHLEGVSPAQINAEPSCVLVSSEFENSERIESFPGCLVTETIEGRAERLKGYNIGSTFSNAATTSIRSSIPSSW